MGFSSRKWAEIISYVASRIYFFIIILQIPLFRYPCRIGTCKTPMDIMACQLIGTHEILMPQLFVKALIYPGAIKRSFMRGTTTIPTPHQVFNSYKYNMRGKSVNIDLKHLEVIVGSYLCVAGAVLGLVKRGRISLIGLSMIIWGVTREIITGSKNATQANYCIYPEMIFTLIIAFFSVTKDVRRLIGCCMPNCYSKPRFD